MKKNLPPAKFATKYGSGRILSAGQKYTGVKYFSARTDQFCVQKEDALKILIRRCLILKEIRVSKFTNSIPLDPPMGKEKEAGKTSGKKSIPYWTQK